MTTKRHAASIPTEVGASPDWIRLAAAHAECERQYAALLQAKDAELADYRTKADKRYNLMRDKQAEDASRASRAEENFEAMTAAAKTEAKARQKAETRVKHLTAALMNRGFVPPPIECESEEHQWTDQAPFICQKCGLVQQ